jgi:hypothetical protein
MSLIRALTSSAWSGPLAVSSEIKTESWSILHIAVRITLETYVPDEPVAWLLLNLTLK